MYYGEIDRTNGSNRRRPPTIRRRALAGWSDAGGASLNGQEQPADQDRDDGDDDEAGAPEGKFSERNRDSGGVPAGLRDDPNRLAQVGWIIRPSNLSLHGVPGLPPGVASAAPWSGWRSGGYAKIGMDRIVGGAKALPGHQVRSKVKPQLHVSGDPGQVGSRRGRARNVSPFLA